MSKEAQNYMQEKFHDAIDYARKEFDITYADVLGSIEFVKAEIFSEAAGANLDVEGDDAR